MWSQAFEDALTRADEPKKAELVKAISEINPAVLKACIRQTLRQELSHMSYDDLRELARRDHVVNYSRMSKADLLKALTDGRTQQDLG